MQSDVSSFINDMEKKTKKQKDKIARRIDF